MLVKAYLSLSSAEEKNMGNVLLSGRLAQLPHTKAQKDLYCVCVWGRVSTLDIFAAFCQMLRLAPLKLNFIQVDKLPGTLFYHHRASPPRL
jgi:hypothetical protein